MMAFLLPEFQILVLPLELGLEIHIVDLGIIPGDRAMSLLFNQLCLFFKKKFNSNPKFLSVLKKPTPLLFQIHDDELVLLWRGDTPMCQFLEDAGPSD